MAGSESQRPGERFDISQPDILSVLFTPENVRKTMRRMRAWQDQENEVTHPLRKIILLEYEEGLSAGIAASVATASWSPSPAYVLLVGKRSGTYREMSYPCLVDTIVGRRVIDAIEPHITRDDDNKVFFGRSHSNADRQRGDYENWFKVWLDYTAEIGSALEGAGFTYVFDTDVTQFFPSVDRARAKSALAQRTHAHQTILELLFYCLESWAPRVRYCPVPGLPVEPNDVSRLVAHNFIKGVDEQFVKDDAVSYLRWVDDTVVFVKNEKDAQDVKRRHHLALREMGLSPNASKTSIMSATQYSASRHPDFNKRIANVKASKDRNAFGELISEWFSKSSADTPIWDKVATQLYSLARTLGSEELRSRALSDVVAHQSLVRPALKYLMSFTLDESGLNTLLSAYGDFTTTIESRIAIARFLGDVEIGCATSRLVDAAVGNVASADDRHGTGYARGLFLLCLNKYGDKEHRRKARDRLELSDLQDDQLRLHYLYVFHCRGELEPKMARAVRHLDTPDIALLMRVCHDASEGKLVEHKRCLGTCLRSTRGGRTVDAHHLPFLHALLQPRSRSDENLAWLKLNATGTNLSKVRDGAVRQFLGDELALATR